MIKIYGFFDLDCVSPEFFNNAIKVLPAERVNRIDRYKNYEDKKLSVISYLLCVYGLYDCFSIKNPIIRLEKNGKPFLVDYPDIYFNISHCKIGCVCAVSDNPVGIDIQNNTDYSCEVAEKVCCQHELEYINKKENKSKAFTKIWAMKESYVKMTGDGICAGLKEIDVLRMDGMIRVIDLENGVIAVCS